MHSGELAKLTGVSTDTLRHYERLGLLAAPARTTGNYREYPASAQQRVTLIQRALRISFSLKELKTILATRDSGGLPCREVRDLMRLKLKDLDQQIEHLILVEAGLQKVLKDWEGRLRKTKKGQPARLLETTSTRHTSKHTLKWKNRMKGDSRC
jgi:DNA-binding transcriptional MerR regulator